MNLILTVGPSGAGKSTWANEYVSFRNAVNLNRDDLRKVIFDLQYDCMYRFSKKNEEKVTQEQFRLAENALAEGKEVVISDTNLVPERWNKWKDLATKYNVQFESKLFIAPLGELLERNRRREEPRPTKVIRTQYHRFVETFGINFKAPKVYVPNKKQPTAFIFDIDGTLASMSPDRTPYEWDKVGSDLPVDHLIEVCQSLYAVGHDIIIMSGRSEVCRQQTKTWLNEHEIPVSDLLMRAIGDFRDDRIVKDELFEEQVRDYWNVIAVFDDRNKVVDLWREKNIPCYQVADGDF